MGTINRMTIDYVAYEDRVRIGGLREDGSRVAIWLTRRLLERLLPVLLAWLQEEGCDLPGGGARAPTAPSAAGDRAPGGPGSAAPGPLPRSEPLHEFAQQMARSKLPPVPPVEIGANDRSWLAHAIDVERSPSRLHLRFRCADAEIATASFTAQPLRQWLNILHDAYRKADWPMTVWPDWMLGAALPAQQQATRCH